MAEPVKRTYTARRPRPEPIEEQEPMVGSSTSGRVVVRGRNGENLTRTRATNSDFYNVPDEIIPRAGNTNGMQFRFSASRTLTRRSRCTRRAGARFLLAGILACTCRKAPARTRRFRWTDCNLKSAPVSCARRPRLKAGTLQFNCRKTRKTSSVFVANYRPALRATTASSAALSERAPVERLLPLLTLRDRMWSSSTNDLLAR